MTFPPEINSDEAKKQFDLLKKGLDDAAALTNDIMSDNQHLNEREIHYLIMTEMFNQIPAPNVIACLGMFAYAMIALSNERQKNVQNAS